MKITIDTSGPLFNGLAEEAVDDYIDEVKERIGQFAENRIHQVLGNVLRHPTGYYESHIQTERQGNDQVVHDSDVVYGPWLEGVGSRNLTTRFKGYRTFQKVAEEVDGQAQMIAEEVLQPYLRRMQ